MTTTFKEKAKKALFLGSNLKTWILVCVLGVLLIFVSLFVGLLTYFNKASSFLLQKASAIVGFNASARVIIAAFLLLIGVVVIVYSLYKIYKFFSTTNDNLFENTYNESKLSKGKKIVTIGGGTGQYTLLNGLKEYTSNITAIVTTMDSGGSSGLLKTEFGVLPPGDLRNCMIALSSLPDDMRTIFGKRFSASSSLKGHPIGNLMLTKIAQDDGFEKAIDKMQDLLRVRGAVLPVTYDGEVVLIAKTGDKKFVEGEEKIGKEAIGIKEIFLNKPAEPNQKVLDAIKEADLIVLGPGSLFTSIISNLLVEDVSAAIKRSKAKKIFIMPVMTQYAETHGFKAEDYLGWISKYVDVDYIIMNTRKPSEDILKKYLPENKFYIEPIAHDSKKFIKADLINEKSIVRHDSQKLAEIIYGLK